MSDSVSTPFRALGHFYSETGRNSTAKGLNALPGFRSFLPAVTGTAVTATAGLNALPGFRSFLPYPFGGRMNSGVPRAYSGIIHRIF